ncbi:MAG: hypothetical protein ACXVBE_13110, partial [Bdellovibrionota bacterium]
MVSIATEECADCDRHPAFSVPVPAVFRLMDAKLTEKEKQAGACENLVASKLEDTLRESHKAIHDIMDVTEEKTKNNALLETEFTKLKALPPAEALNCSQVEDIRFLAEALSRRFDQVKEKRTTMIPIAASFLEDSAQSDDEGTADKTLCLIKCTREKGLVPNGKDACSNSCSADEKFFKNAEDAVIESSLLSPTCFDVGSGRIERETIMGFFRKLRAFETQLGEEFANSWAKSEPAMAANESDLFKRLSLANKALLLTLGRNCAYEKVVPQVEKASSLVMTPTMFSGTGFYLSSGKSTYFASARHVA